MAIDKIFNDANVDGIADNIFGAVNNSVSEVKQMQQRKAAENVQMVVEAFKKIETNITEKFDNVTDVIEKRVLTIKDGRDGSSGSDGRNGRDGKPGRDGANGKQGTPGTPGKDGVDGEDGVSVTNANIDFDGSLVISLSSGQQINVGEVVAPDLAEKIKIVSTMSTNGAVGIKDEGTSITAGVKVINFVGANVTATNSGDDVTVNVSAGTGTVTSVAATVPAFLSVAGSPITTTGTLAISLSGTALPVANGGTSLTTLTANNVILGNGASAPTFVAPSTSGNVLTSNGTTWSSTAPATSGTVTSVAMTVPSILSISGSPITSSGTLALTYSGTALPVANGGTGLSSGTSGGVLAYTATGTLASSAALAASALVIGGGAGAAPSTTTTGTGVVTALGVNVGTAGAFVVNGGALGTPSSGTVTNLTGTASININGTVGATTANTGAFSTVTATGTISGGTSGTAYSFSGSAPATSLTLNSSGSLGIGTGSPAAKLTVINTGDANKQIVFSDSATYYGSVGHNSGNGLNEYRTEAGGGHGFFIGTSGTANLTLDSSGNLGVGAAPVYRAQVTAAATNGSVVALGIENPQAAASANLNAAVDLRFDLSGSGAAIIRAGKDGDYTSDANCDGNLQFYTNLNNQFSLSAPVERMRLDSSGNLGIGKTAPTTVLDIIGAPASAVISIQRSDEAGYGGRVACGNTIFGPATARSLGLDGFNSISFGIAGTEKARMDSGGIFTMNAYGAGTATFSAAGVISSVSDETWKVKDGVPVDTDAMLKKLEPGYWYYNDEKKETFGVDRQLGFYAQNVNAAIGPEAAPTPEEGKPWGYYDRSVLAITVMSLQKALATIETLTARITALETA